MWHKYTAKWGVQMPGMNFQTRSNRVGGCQAANPSAAPSDTHPPLPLT
ncbi:DUF6783 domain-containing protein [Otoolea muris]